VVDLVPKDAGTEITWTVSFGAKYPGTGWMLQRAFARFVQQCVNGLAKHASA
jgi:hypothetical protein